MFVKTPYLTEEQAEREMELLRKNKWQYSDSAFNNAYTAIKESTIVRPRKNTFAVPMCIGGRWFT